MCYAGTKTGAVEIKEEGGADRLLSIVKSHKFFHIQSSPFGGGLAGYPFQPSVCLVSISPLCYCFVWFSRFISHV